jgi:hypothetical protein
MRTFSSFSHKSWPVISSFAGKKTFDGVADKAKILLTFFYGTVP